MSETPDISCTVFVCWRRRRLAVSCVIKFTSEHESKKALHGLSFTRTIAVGNNTQWRFCVRKDDDFVRWIADGEIVGFNDDDWFELGWIDDDPDGWFEDDADCWFKEDEDELWENDEFEEFVFNFGLCNDVWWDSRQVRHLDLDWHLDTRLPLRRQYIHKLEDFTKSKRRGTGNERYLEQFPV